MRRCIEQIVIGMLFSFGLLTAVASEKPNILLIVSDDMGFADVGCFGGEIDTPNIDRLASQGVRFSNYHVNPMCVVTRTSLMSGQPHSQSDNYRQSLPIARLMRQAGYATSIVGKWHQPGNPLDAGFDSFCGFLQGQIDCWTGSRSIQEGRNEPGPVPAGWYSTDAFTDRAMQEIDSAVEQGKPFFTYLAYNAAHTPAQAPRENVEKYYERYRRGWDVLRQERFARMKDLGVVDDRYVLTEADAEVSRWDELSPEMQETESRCVSAYAGMVDRMDWNIGRLLDHLEEKGLDENTLVIFFSDNGGDYANGNIRTRANEIPWKPGSHPFVSTGWSYLKCTPFRWYKTSAHEGGVCVFMIARNGKLLKAKPGSILHQRLHVTDWYPTFLELAGVSYPDTDNGRHLEPLYGNSMLPLFNNPSLPETAIHDEIFWEISTTSKGLLKGDWKIASINDGSWRLYNMQNDPAESRDLAAMMPEKTKELEKRWYAFANEHTKMPPSWKQPVKDSQPGWGVHRLNKFMPAFESAEPLSSAIDVPVDTALKFRFSKPIQVAESKGKKIGLYTYADINRPVWETEVAAESIIEGGKTIRFKLPPLAPNTTYFLLADAGWISVGGKPAPAFNDGVCWYHFRTVKSK